MTRLPCWCDFCQGRAGVHGEEAKALYREQLRTVFARRAARYADERADIAALMRQQAETDAIRAVILEPLGLAGYPLPLGLVHPPGTCRVCHLGPLYEDTGLCAYCNELAILRNAAGSRVRRLRWPEIRLPRNWNKNWAMPLGFLAAFLLWMVLAILIGGHIL